MKYRLYSFVAHHYLSPLQCGLQTAHVVSNLSTQDSEPYADWATFDKTIIICGAGNHAGVQEVFKQLRIHNNAMSHIDVCDQLPQTIFFEDEQSMNNMATACGIIVPERFFGAVWDDYNDCYTPADGGSFAAVEHAFVTYLKSFRLV